MDVNQANTNAGNRGTTQHEENKKKYWTFAKILTGAMLSLAVFGWWNNWWHSTPSESVEVANTAENGYLAFVSAIYNKGDRDLLALSREIEKGFTIDITGIERVMPANVEPKGKYTKPITVGRKNCFFAEKLSSETRPMPDFQVLENGNWVSLTAGTKPEKIRFVRDSVTKKDFLVGYEIRKKGQCPKSV